MCCFTATIEDILGTSIFVGPVVGRRQFVIYHNRVRLHEVIDQNGPYAAMILPFPTRGGLVHLLDLSAEPHRSIFQDLRCAFPVDEMELSGTSSTSSSSSSSSGSRLLEVTRVGSYMVSVAHSLQDLDRADGSVFRLPPALGDIFRSRYGVGFGFIIAAFWNDLEKHPLGYIHDRAEETLFVPTRHYHDGHSVYVDAPSTEFVMENGRWVDAEMHKFDHEIFSLNTDAGAGLSVKDFELTYKALYKERVRRIREHDNYSPSYKRRTLWYEWRTRFWNRRLQSSLAQIRSSLPLRVGVPWHSLRFMPLNGQFYNDDIILKLGRSAPHGVDRQACYYLKPRRSPSYRSPLKRRFQIDEPVQYSSYAMSSSSRFSESSNDPVIEL